MSATAIANKPAEKEAEERKPTADLSVEPNQITDRKNLRKTSGERFYDVVQFLSGKVLILAATAVLAFAAHTTHGPDKILGIPNYLKQFQGWFRDKLLNNKVLPLGKTKFGTLIAWAGASTMIISHGGNFFAPFMKWLENSREKISNFWNRNFGTEEEVEIAHERLKDIPKQSWGDIIKGRAISWGVVFCSILAAYAKIGTNKKSGNYWLDDWEKGFGKVFAGVFGGKEGKKIRDVPFADPLTPAQKANKTFRFGKILALDLFATTAGILTWNLFSRKSAKDRAEAEKATTKEASPIPVKIDNTVQRKADDKIVELKGEKKEKETPKVDKTAQGKVNERIEAVKHGEKPGPSKPTKRSPIKTPTPRDALTPKAIGYADEETKKRTHGVSDPIDEVGVQL